jgi:transposase
MSTVLVAGGSGVGAPAGSLDLAELGEDIAAEVRLIKPLDVDVEAIEDHITTLYDDDDPGGIVASMPGLGVTLAAGIVGRTGDLNRFDNARPGRLGR